MKDFEKTETEVTIIHNFTLTGPSENARKVRVVFEREAYDRLEEYCESKVAISMEISLDSRIYSYLHHKPVVTGAELVSSNGIKSVIFLDETKKDDRSILL